MFKQLKEQFGMVKKLAKKQPKSLQYEELEQRVLFSADVLPGLDIDAVEEQVLVEDIANDVQVEREVAPVEIEQTAAEQRWELVFVNTNVADYEQLIADLQGSDNNRIIEVVVLESDRDGIEQVTETLAERSDLAALHFITHGADGQINLGDGLLNSTTLQQNRDAVAGWGGALSEDGDILFYGCNLAETEAGQSLIEDLSKLTLADVAASVDLTGDASQGGDWQLEFINGKVESEIALSAELQQEYQHTLATYTVSSLADSGAGSLRQAIIDANANGGADVIEFSVAGTVNLVTELPHINSQISIDGSTAPGYVGEPLVILDGSAVGSANGLTFAAGADSSNVNGLAIIDFTGNGIQIDSGSDGNTITGNWIGTTGNGSTGVGNSNNGINVQGANTIIGGTGSIDGNVITNNGNEGINLTGVGATGTIIQGNIIGLDPDGSTGLGNGDVGIALLSGAHNTTIGGTTEEARNIISNNYEGIEINSNNNTVQGNYIGTDITGTLDRGNDSDDGIEIQNGATGNLIGGVEAGAGNLIAFNFLDGINILSGSGNAVLGNDIHSNGDQDIDLGDGANSSQTAPALTTAAAAENQIVVTGSLASTANDYFRIEFFATTGGIQTYIGYANVATDGVGNATINATLNASVGVGALISATATNSDVSYTTFTDSSELCASIVAIAANDTPVANADTITVAEGGTAALLDGGAGNVLANDSGLGDTPVTVSLVTDVTQGTLTLNADGTFSYTHNGSENFSDSFTYQVTDNDGQTSDATVNITINPINDNDPVAADDSITVDEGATITTLDGGATSVLANDTDTDLPNDSLTVALDTDVTYGTLTLNADGTFSYTHDGSENFTDSFTYNVSDADGGVTDTGTVSITINPINDNDPVATDDSITVDEGATITTLDGGATSVLANDTDTDQPNDSLSVTLDAGVSNGSLTLNADGTFSYTHDGSENFTDSFTYIISDADGGVTDTGTVSITINPINDNNPVAADDSITVDEGATITTLDGGATSVLANDTDTDLPNDTLSVALGTGPSHGSLTLNADGTFSYTHDGSENFTDSFTYSVSDADGGVTDTGTVSITINPINDGDPVAIDDSITVNEGTTITTLDGGATSVLANDTDTDLPNDTLSVALGTGPSHGSLTLNIDGTFSYTHDGSENFTDSFTYTVSDADGGVTDTGTVSITINPINDNDPVATDDSITVDEGATITTLDGGATSVLANDTDTDLPNDTLSVALGTGPSHGSLTLNADGTFSYTHDGSENFTDSFTYNVSDANGGVTDTGTVSITVNPINDNDPVAIDDSITVNEGATITTLDGGATSVLANDTDTDLPNDSLSVTLDTNVSNGSLTLNADGTFSYTHDGSENFTDSFTYIVSDADGGVTDTGTVSITVNPINDNNPVAVDDSITVDEGATITTLDGGASSVLANDTDTDLPNDSLTVTLDTDVSHGTLTLNADGTFSYTHDGSENFTDSFTYVVSDADGGITDTGTVSITINPINDGDPVAVDDSITVNEGATATTLDGGATSVLSNDLDADLPGDTLTATLDTDVSHGTLTLNADGTLSYTHDGSENFTDSFTYTVSDADGGVTDIGTVSITINPINDNDPFATDDSITVDEGATITTLDGGATSVLANDTDTDLPNDTLTVSLGTGPTYGSLTLNADGTFSYTHDGSENFTDSFTYIVSDADGGVTDTGTVSITINPINDNNPVAVDDSITVDEGATITTLDGGATSVLANDTDTDLPNDTLTVSLGTGPTYGSLTLNADGTFSYTHDGSENFTDSFTYIVSDADGGVTDTGTVSITINPINDNNPVAVDDSITVDEGATITTLDGGATSVLANDTDTDLPNDTLTVSLGTGPTYGSLTLNVDGTFSHTHDGSENFTDSFTYIVSDVDGGVTDTGTVSITINPINDNDSVATDDSITVDEGATITTLDGGATSVLANDTDTDLPNDTLSVALGTGPAHGSLTLNADGTFSYTHDGSENFTDSFTYIVNDANGGVTDTGTVSITINPINDAPTVTSSAVTTATEDAAYSYTITTSDVDGDALSITAPILPAWLTLVDNGDGTATLSGTPTDAEVGDHSVVLEASDSSGSDTQNFTLNVSGATIDPPNDDSDHDEETVIEPGPIIEVPETDEVEEPDVEAPTYEDPVEDAVIEDEQPPPVERYSTPQDSTDSNDQLVQVQDPELEGADEIIYLTDEDDSDIQPEGRDDDRSYIYFDNDLYKDMHYSKYLVFDNATAENTLISWSGDDFSILDFNSDDPDLVDVNGEYDLLRQEIDESFNTELKSQALKTKIVTVTTASFTVGIVSYLLRAGSMVSSLMSSLPLWRGFDPIAIFSGDKKKQKDRNKLPNTDELKSETLFDGDAE